MADVVEDRTGLGLVPLVPVHVPEQREVYSDELVSLLDDDKRRKRVWNIALTGGYGSGKSSVLVGVRERLAPQGGRDLAVVVERCRGTAVRSAEQ